MKKILEKNHNKLKNSDLTMIIPIKASDFPYVEQVVPLVKKNIAPKSIIVISSDEIKEKCKKLGVGFHNENKLFPGLSFSTVKNKLEELNIPTNSAGWFLQQFIKLCFASVCPTEYYISWDADMLPIRHIDFFDSDNKPYLTLKKEYCKRYFITLKRLLNLDKNRNESYVSEHMVFYKKYVKELIKEIEKTSFKGKYFWEKILFATLPNSISDDSYAFSEFETYGTWVTTKYPGFYTLRRLNMFRHAKYFLGVPSLKDIKWASKSFDTLSFEHFDDRIVQNSYKCISRNLIPFSWYCRISSIFFDKQHKTLLKEFDWFFKSKTRYELVSEEERNYSDGLKLSILYDASLLNNFDVKDHGRSGVFWVAFNILLELAKRDNVLLYLYSDDMEKTQKFFNAYKQDLKNVRLHCDYNKYYDFYFCPFGKVSDKINKSKIKRVSILHDCIPLVIPEYKGTHEWFNEMLTSLNGCDYYFTNSEHTLSDFLKYCPKIDKNKITPLTLATNLPYKPNTDKEKLSAVKAKYNIPSDKKYIFSLCSLAPHKNLVRAVKTFIQFVNRYDIKDMVFVIGGGAYDGFIKQFKKQVTGYNKYKHLIVSAGYIDDEDLESLYSNSEWFVYTSQYEGFGMPPLEAMACACPVITSNNSSLPEVVGDAGIMIDWDNDEQHIAAYKKYYFDKKYREQMSQKGLKRSKSFSWQKTVDDILKTLSKIKENNVYPEIEKKNHYTAAELYGDNCKNGIITNPNKSYNGILSFGPYITMDKGLHSVLVKYDLTSNYCGIIDIVFNQGTTTLIKLELPRNQSEFKLDFTLDVPASDLEIRFFGKPNDPDRIHKDNKFNVYSINID